MTWLPRPRNYTPGDGTLPDGPVVGVWWRGEWHDAGVLFQRWGAPVTPAEPELWREWWVEVRVRGHAVWVRAADCDWGETERVEATW